jgi:hypothetical protein
MQSGTPGRLVNKPLVKLRDKSRLAVKADNVSRYR